MRRWSGRRSRCSARVLRHLLTVVLALAYIFVGFGGEISCAQETLENNAAIDVSVSPESKSPESKSLESISPGQAEQGSSKATQVVDHCYTCVPLLIPAPVLIAEPLARPAELPLLEATVLVEDHPGLDTPPPKRPS